MVFGLPRSRREPSTVSTAVEQCKHKTLEKLLRQGHNPNECDSLGRAPITLAKDPTTFRLLLTYGADPNIESYDGDTMLMKVFDMYFPNLSDTDECVDILLHYGADPNKKSKRTGVTPTHEAAYNGGTRSLKAVLLHGGDPYVKDHKGHTAFDWANKRYYDPHKYIDILNQFTKERRKRVEFEEPTAPMEDEVSFFDAPSAPMEDDNDVQNIGPSKWSTECSICYNTMGHGTEKRIATGPCGHIYCLECWNATLERCNTCPQCRTEVNSQTLVTLYTC